MKVLVTGATGFIGNHVAKALLRHGYAVHALVRPLAAPRPNVELPPAITISSGDIQDFSAVRQAIEGCDAVCHMAALYDLWSPNPRLFYDVNVRGTQNVMRAAKEAAVRRVVYTSSVATISPAAGAGGRGPGVGGRGPGVGARVSDGTATQHSALSTRHFGTEEAFANPDEVHSHYKRSKILAERVALDAAGDGLPVVVVNPSAPVGSADYRPTPTGKVILDFLRHRMPAFVDTGLNLIDVEDVAEGHVLALEKGRVGERYILGNENITLKTMLSLLASETGGKAPRIRLPFAVALAAGAVSQLIDARLRHTSPAIPLDGVRMAAHPMFYDASKARCELGLPQTPINQALRKSADWFQRHGYCE